MTLGYKIHPAACEIFDQIERNDDVVRRTDGMSLLMSIARLRLSSLIFGPGLASCEAGRSISNLSASRRITKDML